MLRYHVAFYLPRKPGEMVVAEALDFPGAVTQGFDFQDARLMIASALEDLAQALLEDGKPLPLPARCTRTGRRPDRTGAAVSLAGTAPR
jgi:predicted RNase H-like HicB family nuclease